MAVSAGAAGVSSVGELVAPGEAAQSRAGSKRVTGAPGGGPCGLGALSSSSLPAPISSSRCGPPSAIASGPGRAEAGQGRRTHSSCTRRALVPRSGYPYSWPS